MFPANKFFGQWRNLKGQLSALYHMANAPKDLLSLVACSKRKVIDMDDFAASSSHVRVVAAQLVNEQLNSLDLFECVLNMEDTIVAADVKVFTEMMVKKCPELVFLGLVQIHVRYNLSGSLAVNDTHCSCNQSLPRVLTTRSSSGIYCWLILMAVPGIP